MINNNSARDIYHSYRNYNSPFNEKNNILDISPSQSVNNNNINNKENIIYDNNQGYMTEEKSKDLAILLNKKNMKIKLDNNINNFGLNNNNIKKIKLPINNNALSITEPNIIGSGRNNLLRNKSNARTANNSIFSNNNNNSLMNDINNNLTYNKEYLNNVLSNKKQVITDESIDYIDYLKKQFETDNKNSNYSKIEANNKELLKRCQDLIEDNRLLNAALNERTAKLNKTIQENLSLKSKIEEYKINIQKNEQKNKFYEEQFNLFKNNNENYQKIIYELKSQNDKLNSNLIKMQGTNNEFQKQSEENFKNKLQDDILNIKQNLKELYNIKNNNNNFDSQENDNKIKNLIEEIKILKEKNNELTNQIEIMNLENKKLIKEKELYHNQVDTYANQINDLSLIIKNKDNLINALKEKEMENLQNEKIKLNKSKSCAVMKS